MADEETPQEPEVTEATETQAPPERTWPVTVYKGTVTHQCQDQAELDAKLEGGHWSLEPPAEEPASEPA